MTKKILAFASLLSIAASTALGVLATPLIAQDQSEDPNSEVCMVRPTDGDGSPVKVITPQIYSQSLEAKGFTALPCEQAFPTMQDKIAWRDEVCSMVAMQSSDIHDQLEQVFGERPAVLCALAEEIVGPWQQN